MKRIFFVVSTLLLASYISIPEYSSAHSAAYSSIVSYSPSPSSKEERTGPSELSENKTTSVDNINPEIAYENSESPNEESYELAENFSMMMTKAPLTYNGKFKLDDDGIGSIHHDILHNNETSLNLNSAVGGRKIRF